MTLILKTIRRGCAPASRAFCFALCLSSAAMANAGDDHGHGEAAPAAAAPALPRFAAVSDAFELVGVLDDTALTLYLDRAETNEPVAGARIELDIGGTKLTPKETAPGEYAAGLPKALAPGVLAVTASVVAGQESDLLAGELDLHADEHADEHASSGNDTPAQNGSSNLGRLALPAGALVVAAGGLGWWYRRRSKRIATDKGVTP